MLWLIFLAEQQREPSGFTPRIEPAFRAKLWRDTSESNYALLWRSTIY